MSKENNEIQITGLNHITFAVSNLDKSIDFYRNLFGVAPLARSEKLAYFSLAGVWFALNVEEKIASEERDRTYTHIAFSMTKENQDLLMKKLDGLMIDYEIGRPRNIREGHSIYVRDYDGHLVEFHNRTLEDRISYYQEERQDVEILL